jgi:hypothetical protein
VDRGRRNKRIGDRQSCRKIKQQAKNYREITSKYKAKGVARQKNYRKTKAKQGKANVNKENKRRDARAQASRKSLKEVAVEA